MVDRSTQLAARLTRRYTPPANSLLLHLLRRRHRYRAVVLQSPRRARVGEPELHRHGTGAHESATLWACEEASKPAINNALNREIESGHRIELVSFDSGCFGKALLSHKVPARCTG